MVDINKLYLIVTIILAGCSQQNPEDIAQRSLIIDTHIDTPYRIKSQLDNYGEYENIALNTNYNFENKPVNAGYGPAWKRLSNNKNLKQGTFISNKPSLNLTFESEKEFKTGDRVFHIKFGMGHVTNFNGDKLEINFDQAGHKKIKSNFVEKK